MEGSSNSQPSTSLSNLLCDEDKSCLNEADEHKLGTHSLNSQLVPYYHDSVDQDYDFLQMLLQKERISVLNQSFTSSIYPSWLKNSRSLAINWILNTQKTFGFQNHTVYLSVIYLDRFLSTRFIDERQSWAVRLVSVACLSVAAKMEESKVPALSEYKVENYVFVCDVIQHMELIVLSALEWKMSLNTPFLYFNYFIKELGDQETKPDDLFSRGSELVMALIRECSKMEEYRPFVVAAAAVMAASDWQLTREALKIRISTVSLWEVSDNQLKQQQEEQLISCYSLMQRLCATSMNNPSTPNLTEVDQTATTPRLAGTKRSLTFRDIDPNPDLPDDEDRD